MRKNPKTIRDADLASIKAIFAWAAANLRLADNPARDVRIRAPRAHRSRERGFTRAEAVAILNAASSYRPASSAEHVELSTAKRWVPWLAAHTGARVAELTQLRKEDLHTRGGIHFLRLTPEAGSIKNGQYRDVPLHAQLIELGFLDFVRAAQPGPLFYRGASKRTGVTHPSKQSSGRISQWIRSLEIIPPTVDPNHGWRHRFKTIGREAGIDSRVLDSIQGHAPRTPGEQYGHFSIKTLKDAIDRLPYIDFFSDHPAHD